MHKFQIARGKLIPLVYMFRVQNLWVFESPKAYGNRTKIASSCQSISFHTLSFKFFRGSCGIAGWLVVQTFVSKLPKKFPDWKIFSEFRVILRHASNNIFEISLFRKRLV